MGTNLPVLKRIKETGDIFLAWDDRPWILDGAAVRVAIVGFDDGSEQNRLLNGTSVQSINPDLTVGLNLTIAKQLSENQNLAFIGTQKSGPFDIDAAIARNMLTAENSSGLSNADVIVPWVNGSDLVQRNRDMFIIDFPSGTSEDDARKYEVPFAYIEKHVKPSRTAKHFEGFPFWIHWNTRPAMRLALAGLSGLSGLQGYLSTGYSYGLIWGRTRIRLQ